MNKAVTSAYIHMPFCVRKCPYCDFISYAGCLEQRDAYITAVNNEIILTATCNNISPKVDLKTIYFGGGTPSLFSATQIGLVLTQLRTCFGISADAEITLEVNPGTVNAEDFKAYRAIGINRLSLGVQTFSLSLLQSIERIHSPAQALDAISWAQQAGFHNISCDLMIGLPGQTEADVDQSVTMLLDKNIPHISFYSLIIEEGTPFYGLFSDREDLLPEPVLEREMYYRTLGKLEQAGFIHYEISNAAKPGYESRHNQNYWQAGSYYGFGCGAHSYYQDIRRGNIIALTEYIDIMTASNRSLKQITAEYDLIDQEESQKEYMLLGFRLLTGILPSDFKARYGLDLDGVFGRQLEQLVNQHLITFTNGRYRLTEYGLDLANEVFRVFVSD